MDELAKLWPTDANRAHQPPPQRPLWLQRILNWLPRPGCEHTTDGTECFECFDARQY